MLSRTQRVRFAFGIGEVEMKPARRRAPSRQHLGRAAEGCGTKAGPRSWASRASRAT